MPCVRNSIAPQVHSKPHTHRQYSRHVVPWPDTPRGCHVPVWCATRRGLRCPVSKQPLSHAANSRHGPHTSLWVTVPSVDGFHSCRQSATSVAPPSVHPCLSAASGHTIATTARNWRGWHMIVIARSCAWCLHRPVAPANELHRRSTAHSADVVHCVALPTC